MLSLGSIKRLLSRSALMKYLELCIHICEVPPQNSRSTLCDQHFKQTVLKQTLLMKVNFIIFPQSGIRCIKFKLYFYSNYTTINTSFPILWMIQKKIKEMHIATNEQINTKEKNLLSVFLTQFRYIFGIIRLPVALTFHFG